MNDTVTVLLCGVGGQGTILAADLLAKTALANGLEVKVSEIHGMSQRGGSVTTTVRFGSHVHSMVHDLASCDYIVSFEAVEALRNLPYLKENGILIVSDEEIKSLPVLIGNQHMPKNTKAQLNAVGAHLLDANGLALRAGNIKTSNVVLLGYLAKFLGFSDETWEEVIASRVPPKTIEINLAAFHKGKEA